MTSESASANLIVTDGFARHLKQHDQLTDT